MGLPEIDYQFYGKYLNTKGTKAKTKGTNQVQSSNKAGTIPVGDSSGFV